MLGNPRMWKLCSTSSVSMNWVQLPFSIRWHFWLGTQKWLFSLMTVSKRGSSMLWMFMTSAVFRTQSVCGWAEHETLPSNGQLLVWSTSISVLKTEPKLWTSVVQHSCPAAVALGKCASASHNARISVDNTRRQESMYWQNFLQSVGLMVAGTYVETYKDISNVNSCVSDFAKNDRKCLKDVIGGVQDVSQSVLILEGSRDKYLTAPSWPVRRNLDVLQQLKAVHDKSNHFLSSHWGLKEVPSCEQCKKGTLFITIWTDFSKRTAHDTHIAHKNFSLCLHISTP